MHFLRPTNPFASRVILCGDPGRCLSLATVLLDRPLMANHARGLWGYTGGAADGAPLTIQASGLGAASAAIVVDELCRLGVEQLVRVGTARPLAGAVAGGDVIAVTGAIADDGPSRALGAIGIVGPDAALTAGLHGRPGLVVTTDVLAPVVRPEWADAVANDLQTATVLRVAERHGIAAAAALVVNDGGLDDAALLAAVVSAAGGAAAALGIPERVGL